MKKHGFTLSELLVSLGIVGVVAAMVSPLLSNIMPDKNKVEVLKVYKTINDITQDLLNDPSIYHTPAEGTASNCYGLGCAQMPLVEPYNTTSYVGNNKYQNLLFSHLEGKRTGTYIELTNGVIVSVQGKYVKSDGTNFYQRLYIDLNGTGSPNCSYNAKTCKKPDSFNFYVDINGTIFGNDPLTKAYLENPYKLNDKKADYKKAKEYSSK